MAAAANPLPVTEQPKAFWGNGLTLTHQDGTVQRLRITAARVLHRRRVSQWFVYENFDEIVIQSLAVDYPLPVSHDQRSRLRLPLQELGDDLNALKEAASLGPEDAASDEAGSTDTLSRVLVENVKFKLIPPGQPPIELSASNAKMGGDFAVIQLEGAVSLTSRACRIRAPLALWSSQHEGLLFPAGYAMRQRRYDKPAFFRLNPNGTCRRILPLPPVAYVDLLEIQEAAFMDRLTRNMPAYTRFMLGAGLSR